LQAADKARVQEAQLEREAAANRTIYESYLARYKQTIEQDGIAKPDASIISRAQASSTPASPNMKNWLLVGLVIGSAVGVGIAFVRELTDKRIRSARFLTEQTGYPVLGAIPNVPHPGRNQPAVIRSDPRFGEALVALQATVRLAQQVRGARIIAIASSRVGEGKTTVTANLARSLAAAGLKVLAIDCNFSKPALSNLFGVAKTENFESIITMERQNPNSLISLDSASGVSVMAGSAGSTSSGLLLANKNFRGMLATLRERFDVILMDGPALSQSLDAWQIASIADGVIMAVCKSKSRIDVVKSNLDRLTDYGCPVLGIIIDRHMDRAILPHTVRLAPVSERAPQGPKSGKIYGFPEVAQST
jgi:polysaccharide biosynthesis transport protein